MCRSSSAAGPSSGRGDGSRSRRSSSRRTSGSSCSSPAVSTKSSTGASTPPSTPATAQRASRNAGRRCSTTLDSVRNAADLAAPSCERSHCMPLSEQLVACGAFRADVSGAGPCVYGLFSARRTRALRRVAIRGRTWSLSDRPVSGRGRAGPVDGHGPRQPLAALSDRWPGVRVHSASRFTGAWPSGKATGFGPVIPGSNPGAPANVPTVSVPPQARSRRHGRRPWDAHALGDAEAPAPDPRSPDGRLGHRGGAAARPRAARRRRLARHGRRVRRARRSRCRSSALGTGDAVRCARRRSPAADEVLVLSGDTPLLTTELLEALLASTGRRAAAATVLSFVPGDIRSYGRIVRDADGDLEAIVEAADASPEQLAIGEANSSIYVFRARSALAGARPAPAGQRAGRAVPHRRRARPRRGGHRVAVHVAADPDRDGGRQHARRARRRRRRAARPDQRRPHARRRHDRRSRRRRGSSPTVTLEADTVGASVHAAPRRDERRRGRRDRPARRRRRRRDRSRRRSSGRSVTFAPEPCSGHGRRRARSWSSRTRGWTRTRRCPISAISATRRSEQERTSVRARSRRTSITAPACRRSER